MTSKSAVTAAHLFEPAMDAARQFQKKFDEAQKFRHNLPDNEKDISAFVKLLGQFAFHHDGTAPTFDGPFKEWCTQCFEMVDIDDPDAWRVSGVTALAVADGKQEPEVFFELLDAYSSAIQKVLDASAPARFGYQGFKIENPERMGEQKCRYLLEGVDYVVALFKKRGVTPILRDTVKTIRLLPYLNGGKANFSAHGFYYPQHQVIEMSAKAIGQGAGRFMKWVNEVFLHEVGHHVHLNFLPPAAKAAWDQGWDQVKDKKKLKDSVFGKISHADRVKYFTLLQKHEWEIGTVAKKLKGIDKIKFGVWLRSPLMGGPLIKPKQWKLTKDGDAVFSFLSNPARELKERYDIDVGGTGYKERLTEKTHRIMENLGIDWSGDYPVPPALVEEMAKADPSISKAVDEAMAKLEIVSDYGKTDEQEDFAETFVAFMDAPAQLTPTAKFRMQRALSLSGLYGKQVMKLALKVAARFMHEQVLVAPPK